MRDHIKQIVSTYLNNNIETSGCEYIPCTGYLLITNKTNPWYNWDAYVGILDNSNVSYKIYNGYTKELEEKGIININVVGYFKDIMNCDNPNYDYLKGTAVTTEHIE
jgi:hypothetical protein